MIALFRQAIRDPLTGVFSRRSGEELLERQFQIALRSWTPLSIAFLDFDHFKEINDRYSHDAGDKALIAAAAAMTKSLRLSNILVRWGGEEFVLIMPDTDPAEAGQALTRLREAGLGERPDGSRLTASIGFAERSQDRCGDWRRLVEAADRRMYLAKQGGRDRVVFTDAA
ncbi:putative diguanylate cyclase YedQ [mine drainage metagenome]|uniref:Putative diguanylate cyclase YedQ n=1 Tax=mine drainage metagenome TaxID=410659 RepID=A0A1J5RLL7_9ZZZZ